MRLTVPGSPSAAPLSDVHKPEPPRRHEQHRDPVKAGWKGWTGPVAVTALAALTRIWNLGQPHAVMFDETYYAKDGLSLLRFGYEQGTVEDANEILLSGTSTDIFTGEPAFVAHPPLGKWVIAAGEWAFGPTPFGWRIAMAILGVLSVLIVARTVQRLTGSMLTGTLAGFLLAIDGIHLVLSRSALLDMALSFFILCAFALLVIDRDRASVLASRALAGPLKPWSGLRPLRWAAAILLGLAIGVKLSGIWYAVAFALLTVAWDVSAARKAEVARPWRNVFLKTGPVTVGAMAVTAMAVYLITWSGWILSGDGWGRNHSSNWALSLLHYHEQQLNFHTNLSSDHAYASDPIGWLLMARPTAFLYESSTGCGADMCSQEVLALGNPILWWVGIPAIVYLVWRWAARRDWKAGAVVVAITAGWLPWLLFPDRTVFTFYTVVFVPYVAMAVAMSARLWAYPPAADSRRRRDGTVGLVAALVLAVAAAWWLWPVWTGEILPYELWKQRMLLPTWI